MGKMIYKERPGGYMTMPVVITKSRKLTIEEKFVLCFVMGFWINKGDSSFSIGYISESLGLDVSSVKNAMNKLLSYGLLKVSGKKMMNSGDISFMLVMDVAAVNGFFGCELVGKNEATGKTTPTAQPVRKQVMKVREPLAWMESDYYKNREQGCQR